MSCTASAKATASGSVMPPGAHSIAEKRSSMGKPGPMAARTASMTSSAKRKRPSLLPPYASERRFVSGERNWWISQPWPAWSISMSKPARLTSAAPSAKRRTAWAICSCVMARTAVPVGRTPSLGP